MTPARSASDSATDFARRPLWRRAWPLILIVTLHLGFFHLLQNGTLQRLRQRQAATVVTVLLFPPAQPAVVPAPPTVKPVPPKTAARPPPRPRPVAVPVVAPTPAPPPHALAAPIASAIAPAVQAEPPPAAITPQPAAAPTQPKTISSAVQYLQPPQPEYPIQSRRLGEAGRVILRALVNPQGHAERVEVQQSSGFTRLDTAAREAVARALFKPYTEDGLAVAVFIIVPISFRLDQ